MCDYLTSLLVKLDLVGSRYFKLISFIYARKISANSAARGTSAVLSCAE